MKYIDNPITIGEKLLNRRLELRLLQKDMAKKFNVSEETITNWENGHTKPQLRYYPVLKEFVTN